MELDQEEIRLLRQLTEGPQTLSQNTPRAGLKRLVEVGWVTERLLDMSINEYTISKAGRAVLSTHVTEETIPVENLNASNDE